MAPNPIPAHRTKHISLLQYPFRNCCFHLAQLDNGQTNGSALWLGAQCLALYLADALRNKTASAPAVGAARPKAIELGSGIGLSALALSSMGWDVIATDLPDVISAVLSVNVKRNISQLPVGSGVIDVRALDWSVLPEQWVWDDVGSIALPSLSHSSPKCRKAPPFDLIISSDTLYAPDLVQPLLRTLHALCTLAISSAASRSPPIYLCLERRDPILIDCALASARVDWNFTVERVPHKKVAKAMEKGNAKWDREEWEGVEVWKLTLHRTRPSKQTTGSALP